MTRTLGGAASAIGDVAAPAGATAADGAARGDGAGRDGGRDRHPAIPTARHPIASSPMRLIGPSIRQRRGFPSAWPNAFIISFTTLRECSESVTLGSVARQVRSTLQTIVPLFVSIIRAAMLTTAKESFP